MSDTEILRRDLVNANLALVEVGQKLDANQTRCALAGLVTLAFILLSTVLL